MVKVLSIQSAVAYGHVGNSAAVFPLQRIGVEVLPVATVNFSNHIGYGAWRGQLIAPEEVHEIILGIEDRGVMSAIDIVLSGFLGSERIIEVVLVAATRVKAANPRAVYACDPVMGNAMTGTVVAPAIPELLRERVVPVADIITPNQYELGVLTGTAPRTLPETLDAIDRLIAAGPSTVLVTSVRDPDAPDDEIAMIAANAAEAWIVRTPLLPGDVSGTGDVSAALFTAHMVASGDLATALATTTSSVFDLLDATIGAGAEELLLVETQEVFATPRMQFEVARLR